MFTLTWLKIASSTFFFTCTLKSYVFQVASKLGYSRGSKSASTYFWPIFTNFKGRNSANNKLTHVKFCVLHIKYSCVTCTCMPNIMWIWLKLSYKLVEFNSVILTRITRITHHTLGAKYRSRTILLYCWIHKVHERI